MVGVHTPLIPSLGRCECQGKNVDSVQTKFQGRETLLPRNLYTGPWTEQGTPICPLTVSCFEAQNLAIDPKTHPGTDPGVSEFVHICVHTCSCMYLCVQVPVEARS